MVGLGWAEVLILLVCAGLFFGGPIIVALLFFLAQRSRRPPEAAAGQHNASPARQAQPAPPNEMSADSSILVARITHRFCPQCRSPLAADSPEGLCPACLMAGGLGSDVAIEPTSGTAATTPPSGSKPPLVGEIGDLQRHFPQFEILELLGRGGMGAVYKARQKNLDRIVALKVIPPEAAKDPTFAERFNREARALARLNHPSIVTVYDFGEAGELHYLLMEYVDGVNLRQTLRAGRLDPREALAIVPSVCDALQYAHDQGVVHRDIKPENVLLDRSGRVKIADFGLAKLLGKGPDDFTLTRTQQVMGTPRYMAPEQIERPSTVDHRADIYSLGVVFYEMLTGELPIGRFEPPSHKVQLDVRIDEVVLRSLEKDPQRRYQRASEVKTELASATSWPTLAGSAAAPLHPSSRNRADSRPTWHTPAPAAKSDQLVAPPGGVPVAHVLMVAIGMVLGVLLMGGGLAALVFGLIYAFQAGVDSDVIWSWWGAGFGCLVGGFGSAAGSYNTYRRLAGAEDLLASPRVTWFDWVMRVYGGIGVAVLILGGLLFDDSVKNGTALLTLGGIAAFQGLLFLVMRTLYVLSAKSQDERSPPDVARASLQAPGMGLMVAGILTVLLSGIFLVTSFWFFNYNPYSWRLDNAAAPLGMSITNLVPSLSVGILLILAGLSMRRGRAYSLAMAGCIAGLIPNGIAWPITLPLAIWALLTLRESRVQRVFQSSQDEAESDASSAGAAVRAGSPDSPAGVGAAHSCPPSIRRRVFGPALGLIICGILLPLPNIALLVVSLDPREFREYMAGTAPFTGLALMLAIIAAGLMVIGGTKLWMLDTYRLAWIGAIVALVPISPLWAFTLPIGLWALIVLLRPDVQAWFDREAGEQPGPLTARERPDTPKRSRQAHQVSSDTIRRRVAGPAIGLMIVGILGLFPCAAMVLAVPALVVVPTSVQPKPVEESFEVRPAIATETPKGAVIFPASLAMQPPVLLAQREVLEPMDAMARGPLWGIVFAGTAVLLSLPLSLLMIVGGWQMRKMQHYGLAVIAAIAALLPCTFGWMLGLPIGLWALITLLNSDVREAFDREPNEPDTLPEKPTGFAAGLIPAATTGRPRGKVVMVLAVLVVLLLGVGVLVPLLLPAVQSARQAARRAHSQNNLRQIGIALHNYHDVHGAFPPAVVTDASGRPLYSGRVLLLPFLEQGPLYEAFDKSQAWDSPQNRALSQTVLPVFDDPSQVSARATTDYLFITGAGTLFDAGKKVVMTDCRDGLANVMAVAEVRGSGTGWAEPRDLNVSQPVALPAGNYPGGNLILFADSSVRFMDKDLLSPGQVRARATIAGGEPLGLAPERFAAVLRSLQAETFDSGKVSFLRGLDRSQGFTSQQVHQLLEDFDFDNDRVEAAVLLHPHLVDPENFFTVLEAFTFDDGRRQVRERLKLE